MLKSVAAKAMGDDPTKLHVQAGNMNKLQAYIGKTPKSLIELVET